MKDLKPNRALAKPANPDNFDGAVFQQALVPQGNDDLEVLGVWFERGARTRPHIHPVDQLLVVIEGRCIFATQTERVILDAGQAMLVPKGLWHWHGAAPGTNACHLSVKKPGVTDWKQSLHNFND